MGAMAYCPDCGAEVDGSASFCSECGGPLQSTQQDGGSSEASPAAASATSQSPGWPIVTLLGLWILWIVAAALIGVSSTAGGLVMLIAVLVSLPLMYIDAKNAAHADELEISYPIAVPVATLLLWVLALPAYVIYRWSQR
jgi:hypothetical protein